VKEDKEEKGSLYREVLCSSRGSYENNPVSLSELKFTMKSRRSKSVQIMKKRFIFCSFDFLKLPSIFWVTFTILF